MPDIPVTMARDDLRHLPTSTCPDGYRWLSHPRHQDGAEEPLSRIETAASAFPDEATPRAHFQCEFAPVRERLPGRMLFLAHESAGPIGTATA